MLDRRIERELVPLCLSEGLGMMTYSATAVGLLTGRFRRGIEPPLNSIWANNLSRFEALMTEDADGVVRLLQTIAADLGKSPAQVAINWILSKPGITAAMIGPDRVADVDDNFGAVGWSLTNEEIAMLDQGSSWSVSTGEIV